MIKYKNSKLISFIQSLVLNFIIIVAFAGFFNSSLYIEGFTYAFYASVLVTFLYTFLRPLLLLVSIVPIILTFGIFIVIINALIILMVSSLLAPYFVISSFWSALGLAIFISLVNNLVNSKDRTIIIKKIK